jgi:hypothetical protein
MGKNDAPIAKTAQISNSVGGLKKNRQLAAGRAVAPER